MRIKDQINQLMIKLKFRRGVRTMFILLIKPMAFMRMKFLGIQFVKPNYLYFNSFDDQSVIIDAGCGHEAEFSLHMINKYHLNAFGIDPTIKHAPFLKKLEEVTDGRFHYLPLAVSQINGTLTFHESKHFESGSVLPEHGNVKKDETRSYTVESVTPGELVHRIGKKPVDYIKLDLEGAEYKLLDGMSDNEINLFRQIFVEFHYHCTNYTTSDTKVIVWHIRSKGFRSFTLDRHNYLFYR
jgi:FkbM family methyltransferase